MVMIFSSWCEEFQEILPNFQGPGFQLLDYCAPQQYTIRGRTLSWLA